MSLPGVSGSVLIDPREMSCRPKQLSGNNNSVHSPEIVLHLVLKIQWGFIHVKRISYAFPLFLDGPNKTILVYSYLYPSESFVLPRTFLHFSAFNVQGRKIDRHISLSGAPHNLYAIIFSGDSAGSTVDSKLHFLLTSIFTAASMLSAMERYCKQWKV
jgi:hypothetical protein